MNRRLVALGALATIAVAFFVLGGFEWITGDGNVERFLTDTGALGPIVFILVMWCTQPLGLPGFVYMVPAGIVWPWPVAVALSWIGNMGASYIAFYFARSLGRDWVSVRIPSRIRTYDDRLASGGLPPIVALRLLFGQLPPADWLLGVSKVSTRNFVIGTGIGIIPGVVVLVVAGGGLVSLFTDLPTSSQRIVLVVVTVAIIGIRVWRRRSRTSAA